MRVEARINKAISTLSLVNMDGSAYACKSKLKVLPGRVSSNGSETTIHIRTGS